MNSIKLHLDTDNVTYIGGDTCSYAANICFLIDGKTVMPGKDAKADPFYVLRWMLREMRLSLSSKVKERNLYFNVEQGQYIFCQPIMIY